MISVSTEYRRQLIAGKRKWLVQVSMTLADNTHLTIDNDHVWEGGVTIDEAISSDTSFDIGAAIVGSVTLIINNITGEYSQYDFYGATFTLWLGVEADLDGDDNQRYYRKGFYVVDKPSYNGSLITLDCLDNMTWFDTPFSEVTGIDWSNATTGSIMQAICSHVGVSLANLNFPNYTIAIAVKPEGNMSCREVMQYIAQMCCCYCKIDTAGHLVLNWYDKNAIIGLTGWDGGTFDTTTTPYSDGDPVDGMLFNPWDQGDDFDGGTFAQLRDSAYLSNNFDISVSTDDVVVTGCRVRNNASKESAYDVYWVDPAVEADHERYMLVIDDNPFIHSKTKADEIANIVGSTLAGLPMRGYTARSLADFSYETGDMATVIDFRGNRYYSWITRFTFTTTISEEFCCGVESVKKRSEQRFSTLAETIEQARTVVTAYDNAVKEMDLLGQNAIGYTEYTYGTPTVMWRYNGSSIVTTDPSNPKFPGSTVVFKISGDGVFVAQSAYGGIDPDGTCHFTNGYDANTGTAILNLIYVQGLNAGWITAGTISANRIGANSITASKINVDKLSAISAKLGSVDVGGSSNQNGSITVKNSSGDTIGTWNNGGISIYDTTQDCNMTLGNGGLALRNSQSNGPSIVLNKADDNLEATFGAYQCSVRNSGGSRATCSTYTMISYFDTSDKRTKQDIKRIDNDLAKAIVLGIKPVEFRYKHRPEELQFGVIAQDIVKVLKEHEVDENNRLCYKRDIDDMYTVEYKEFIAPILSVIQSQQEEIELLKQEVALLKQKVGE